MKNLSIEIVSDVSCPWCIIGYKGLEKALGNLSTDIQVDVNWRAFELNPNMPMEGQEIVEHLTQKYGISVEQSEQNRAAIKQRGLDVGYQFGHRGGGRIYNTFDAHRLIHWAQTKGKQTELKLALFDLYFQQSGNPSDHQQLLETAEQIGLNKQEAQGILAQDTYSSEVRAEQQQNQKMGITSVPAFIINNAFLISGGQPSEVFEQALKEISQK